MLGKMEIRTPPGSRPRDGRHCDLCGCSQPAVRCDKCGCQIFCLSCDDMYHRHPKRRFHLRKAVDPTPPVPQARPVLPMKVAHLNSASPGDPSKMPLPPPRKKKSLFGSFRKPSPTSDNSPPLPKKEYSWTDRLGSIKKFMSNRPLPPLPNAEDDDDQMQPTTNGQSPRGDLTFIHRKTDERPPQLPQRAPRSPDFPGNNFEKENRVPTSPGQMPNQVRNGSMEPNANHMNQNVEFHNNEENQWNHMNNQNGPQRFGTLQRPTQQRGFGPPGMPGYPGGMHQSSSATDLHSLQNVEGMPGAGQVPPHFPQHYPMNPHMPPHYPYPMYPQYPNYPQYFGNSFANLSNPPTSEGDFSDNSETPSRHSSKKHPFRKRAKRSQSVLMDKMAYPGQFYPFGPYPGYGPWGAPMQMEAPPSPASSIRSLNRSGRTRRRKKMTSEDDDEFSMSSSPVSRPKSSSSDPKETGRAPLTTQTTSSEEESDGERNNRRMKLNTIQRRQSDPPATESPAVEPKGLSRLKKSSSKQSDSDVPEVPEPQPERRPSRDLITEQQQQSPAPPQKPATPSEPPATWECKHCTFANPMGNRICQVCCKTFTPSMTDSPVTAAGSHSRPASAAASGSRKQSVDSEQGCSSPEKFHDVEEESVASRKDRQDMASLNSALDEAEKQISKGLEELMKLKDDIDANMSKDKGKAADNPPAQSESRETSKPVYKSSGRMRTSILDKLNLNKPQTSNASVSTSTDTQTGQGGGWTSDKIIEPSRRHSNSSTTSETYNSPLAQSPDLERGYLANRQKRDSSCQTQQQDSLAEFLERKRAAEEAFLGRPINNFGFDRMDMVTSPVPPMYDRYFGGGGGYGMMQRSHSRASLFTGRMNDFGPMDYGGGFGYGPGPMFRSSSRSSLTGEYPDGRMSEFHNLRKPDFYLSMEELVERRRQENIRAQGLELVRMIREAEQQGFNADDIQVALSHCGKQNPMEWLQDNWRNMVDSVVTLSTNYGNDKKDNDIGLLSENEARDALRLHKGNIWAAVTECVEGRQRKYLELSARGNFPRNDIVDALTASDGDVEMAYAKLIKNTGKPFLMRIWGAGEGAQNQDGARPLPEDIDDLPSRYLKDETLNSDELSEEIWSEDGDWEEDEDLYGDERTGDIEDLQTCREDLHTSPQDVKTPESDSEYCDPFPIDDRNASSPSDDIFFVIPEAKPEKKKGFLSKLSALRRDSKEQADAQASGVTKTEEPEVNFLSKEDTISQNSASNSDQTKNNGALNALKSTLSAIKETVTGGGNKNEKKLPCAQPERRTIIVRGQLDHESLSTDSKDGARLTSIKRLETDALPTPDLENKVSESNRQNSTPIDESIRTNKEHDTLLNKEEVKLGDTEATLLKTNVQAQPVASVNVPKPVESKQTEPKKPQSLAERLKLSKQYRSSTNVSAIQKEASHPAVLGAISGGSKDSKNEPLNDENATSKQKEQLNIKSNDNVVAQLSKDTPLPIEKENRLINATESSKPSPIQQNISKDIKTLSEKPSSSSVDSTQRSSTVSPEKVFDEPKLTSKPELSKGDTTLSKPDDSKIDLASETKPSVTLSVTTDKKEVSKKVVENTEAGTSSIDSKTKVDMHQNVPGLDSKSPGPIKDTSRIIKETEEIKNNSFSKTEALESSNKLAIEPNASSTLAKQKDVLKEEIPQSQNSVTSSKIKDSNENSIIEVALQTSSQETQKDSNTKQVVNAKDIPNSQVDSKSEGMKITISETSKTEPSGSNSESSTNSVKDEIISNADKICAVAENQDISQKSAAILDHSKSQPTEGTSSSSKDSTTSSSKLTLTEEATKGDKQYTPTTTEGVVKEIETIENLQDGKQEKVTGDSSSSDLPTAQIEIAQDVSPNRVEDQNIKEPGTSEIQNIPKNILLEQANENADIQQKPNTATAGETTLETQQFNQEVSGGIVLENKIESEKSLPITTATEEKTLPNAIQEPVTNKDESVTVQDSVQSTQVKPLEEEPKEVQKSPSAPDNSQKSEAAIHKETELSATSSEDKNSSLSTDTIDNTKAGKFKFSKSGKVKKTQAKEDKKDSIKNKDKTVAETASTSSLNKSLNAESGNDIKPSSSQSDIDAKADSSTSAVSKEIIEDKLSVEKAPKVIEAETALKQPVNETTETEAKSIKTEINEGTQQEKELPPQTKSSEQHTSGISSKTNESNSIKTESQISAPATDSSAPSSSTDLKTGTIKTSNTSESDNQKANILTSTNSNSVNIIEKLPTPEVQLQQPVVSKEYPGKKITDGPSSSSTSSTSVSDSSNVNAATSSTEKATVIKEEVKDSVPTDAPKQDSQHSKAQETVVTDTSTSGTNSTLTSNNSAIPTEKKQEIRTADADYKSPETQDSDDTDIEYSDESRPSSVTPPSPVDALRSRFEGLAGGSTVRGQTRPQSPFRRMSLNSRKQVIALERKRDITEKPWYHQKITPEPVKTNIPKRTIRQQLEMERRVRQMVTDRKVRTYRKAEIVVQLMDMNFEEDEAIQAANECSTLEQAISYLQQECLLCAGHYPVSQIVSMTHCQHRACRDCIRAYFTVQIRDRTILDLLCPFCNEPDIGDEDVAQDYFNHLDIMLKKLVDMEIHELFQRKLRDRVLMKDPNFRWCSQCSSGFIAMPNLKRLVCPDCNAVTCASCRRLWEREHQGISCEAFAALKDASDPDSQAADLAKMLTEDGIDCPSCHFRYALAKGGCMHFRCIQCQHDFCSGCSRPFKMGQKCGVSEFCAKLGLHAHHPRNCLFYLRDKEPEDLQKLLEMNEVSYNRELPDGMELSNICQVMEQKETADGMVDDYCGKEIQDGYAGLCRVHYVEYLGQLVNKNKVDPIQIFDNDDLELVLRRANIRLPPKRYRENEAQYREKLVNVIQEELPLDKMDGS